MKISHENGLKNLVLRSIYSHKKDKHPCTYDVLVFPVAVFQTVHSWEMEQKSNPASAVDLASASAVPTEPQDSCLCPACMHFYI